MTRVNVGIHPSELCAQHLLAGLRELPRCFKFRNNAGPEDAAREHFNFAPLPEIPYTPEENF